MRLHARWLWVVVSRCVGATVQRECHAAGARDEAMFTPCSERRTKIRWVCTFRVLESKGRSLRCAAAGGRLAHLDCLFATAKGGACAAGLVVGRRWRVSVALIRTCLRAACPVSAGEAKQHKVFFLRLGLRMRAVPEISLLPPRTPSDTNKSNTMRVPLVAQVAESGARFRALLGPGEVANLRRAQALFHASLFLPALVYFVLKLGDAVPRFPATISWTVRRGLPRLVQVRVCVRACVRVCVRGAAGSRGRSPRCRVSF